MLTSITLGLLTNKIYSLNDVRTWQSPAQYVCAILRYGIECNIVDIANQLLFTYQGLAPELRVFVSYPTKSTKASDFIFTLEKKQEVWHKMMTTPVTFYRYYNSSQRPSPSPYRLLFPSQSEVFSTYQSQQRVPKA